jgi:hypothetical protein
MKKTLLSLLASSLILAGTISADENTSISSNEISTKATQKETQRVNNKKAQLVQEALSSLKLSASALAKLDNKQTQEAKQDIELALGKLESILAAKDTPKLLAIDQRVEIKNFIGSAKDVEATVKSVKTLLSENKIQEARELLSSLQSEIDVTVVSLPLVTYPDALKLASKYIIDDKPEKAKEVLKVALSTFSEVKEIIPIPLVNTLRLTEVASDVSKKDKEQALKYLQSASDELNKAEKLGYISKGTTTYKGLYKLIDKIKKEVAGPNKAEKLFQEFAKKLQEFKENIFSSNNQK